MGRLIDGEKLKNEVASAFRGAIGLTVTGAVHEIIDRQPTIDPESMRRGQWVSVEDGLPAPYKDVIIAVRDGAIHTAFGYHSSSTGKWYEYDSDGGEQEAKITHWMPLPDPPEEDCP